MDATVVVTGATGSFGSRVASAYAAEGAHVVVADHDRAAALSLAERIEADGGTATAERANERDEFDLERLMETASRAGGGIDVVVPAAAVRHDGLGGDDLPETSYSAFDDTVRANARGVFAAVKEALPHFAADGRVLVPVERTTGAGDGAFGIADATRIALVRGFADSLEQAVGAVVVGPVGEAAAADLDRAASAVVGAASMPADGLDGAVLTLDDVP